MKISSHCVFSFSLTKTEGNKGNMKTFYTFPIDFFQWEIKCNLVIAIVIPNTYFTLSTAFSHYTIIKNLNQIDYEEKKFDECFKF